MLHFQSLVSEETFQAIASPTDKLQLTIIILTTYSGDNLHIMVIYDVQVGYKSQLQTLSLVVKDVAYLGDIR